VQDPANATATPTGSRIPIADSSGKLDGWVSLSGKASSDGDVLGVDFVPGNYTSTAVPGLTTVTTELTSHLKGIDTALASAGVGDNSVTLEKLAHGTQGDILYYAAEGAPTLLNAGTAGQVLTTNGAGQNPSWSAASGGSGGIDPVTATAGEDVDQYEVVYLNSSNKIVKAICSSTATEANVLGLVSESGGILTDATGDVTVLGTITNVAWTWDANKWVYLSSVSGGLTQTIPTTNGQYAVPVGIALSSDQIYIQPMTGWVVSDGDTALGCKKVTFDETSGTVAILTPPANAVITQITAVITNAAAGSGGTIQIGVSGDTDLVVPTTVFDLTQAGNHVYDPFYAVDGTPDELILTVTAGGGMFDGVIYLHYAIPDQHTGLGGVASVSFTQATSSPALMVNLPDNVVVTRCTVVVDTTASEGNPTVSIGTVGDADLLFDETDCDLLAEGIYLYDPFVETSGNIFLTITPDSQSFSGRAYVQFMAVQ
jgi:hypothetical protein